jgi:hypothetical protein
MKRILSGLLVVMLLWMGQARAQAIGYYHTGNKDANGANASTTGMENSVIVVNSSPSSSRRFMMLSAVSYNTSAALVAMCFDSATLPADQSAASVAALLSQCSLATATSATQPSTCSFSLPNEGVGLVSGLTCACSTTGKKLTVDTTSGGDCFFGIAWK